MSNIIEINGLTYKYGVGTPYEKTAIENVSLSIKRGEYVGIIGHTGSGKSTLIQHLNGLLKPSAGEVIIAGENLWENKKNLRDLRFKVGLVFQYPEYQLFAETVYDDIAFGPRNKNLSEDKVRTCVMHAAHSVGIRDEQLSKSPFELSGGQKRRVAIAGIIAMEPEVIIFDEPTAGLDPRGRDQILSEIRQYHRERGATILLVSHSMEDIASEATMALVMDKGRLFCYDTVDNVFARGDELDKLGLSVPQVSRVFSKLGQLDSRLSGNIYTIESAKSALLSILSTNKKG